MNKPHLMERLENISKKYMEKLYGESVEYCGSYGEPGYSDPVTGILFSNWNDFPKRVMNFLESKGFELEWSDEWIIDYYNDKAYRTSPDCYSWTPSYLMTDDGDLITKDYGVATIADYLTNDPYRCDIFDCDFSSEGFEKSSESYENGFHAGQTDNPKKIYDKLESEGFDVIFQLTEQSQFYTVFTVWTRKQETE